MRPKDNIMRPKSMPAPMPKKPAKKPALVVSVTKQSELRRKKLDVALNKLVPRRDLGNQNKAK